MWQKIITKNKSTTANNTQCIVSNANQGSSNINVQIREIVSTNTVAGLCAVLFVYDKYSTTHSTKQLKNVHFIKKSRTNTNQLHSTQSSTPNNKPSIRNCVFGCNHLTSFKNLCKNKLGDTPSYGLESKTSQTTKTSNK